MVHRGNPYFGSNLHRHSHARAWERDNRYQLDTSAYILYIQAVKYEWDPDKNKTNLEKHGISFEEACQIFKHDVLTSTDERKDYKETRKTSIGTLEGEIIIVVIHTNRNGTTRIISARPAKMKERKRYYEYFKTTP